MAADNTCINILDIFYPCYGLSLSLFLSLTFILKYFLTQKRCQNSTKNSQSLVPLIYTTVILESILHQKKKKVYKYIWILEALFVMMETGKDLSNQNRGIIT